MKPRLVPALGWPADAMLRMPGSKSVANRLLVAAASIDADVTLCGITPSDDVQHLLNGLQTLGYGVTFDAATERATIQPRGPNAPTSGTLFCGNAGTALRFLVSLAAITPGIWTLTGDAAMERRPIGPLVDAWRRLGVDITATDGCPPVQIRSDGPPAGGRVELDASASSQFASSLLLVGHRLPAGLDIRFAGDLASRAYAQLTCRALAAFGVAASVRQDGASVRPGHRAPETELHVAGDWSSMGVWTCLEHLTGSRLQANNLDTESGQADEALAAALLQLPPHGDATIDVSPFPDQFLNLAVVAALSSGVTRLVGGHNLRWKECDRIAVAARELRAVGGDCTELGDGLIVHGGRPLHGATIAPENDHRVAMAFALLGLLVPGIAIADPDCVTKSYPGFWRDLTTVLEHRRPLAIVGMRAAGKTTLARALAAATGARHIDTDERFVAAHGPIAAFVQREGWPAFRSLEERLVEQALQPNTIVSTGGGAIESVATRGRLRERAHVLWLDAPLTLLRERLAAAGTDRPSVTGAPVLEELAALQQRRQPLYAAVAHRRLDATQLPESLCAAVLTLTGDPPTDGRQ